MITLQDRPRAVEVGHWHIERPVYDLEIKQYKGKHFKEVRYDYIGLLHGFGVEGESENSEMYAFALVEKADGTFATPSVTVIRLIVPTTTLSGPA